MKIELFGTIEDIVKEMKDFITKVEGGPCLVAPKMDSKDIPQGRPVVVVEPTPAPIEVPKAPVVPVTTTTYTLADLQKMAGEFVQKDKNNKTTLVEILTALGARALTELPEVQFGAFVQKMKDVGADI